MSKLPDAIVISTTEQCEAMLAILERCAEIARKDDYASERKRPVRRLTCACCGQHYRGRQWFNQDTGYGLGDCCVEFCRVDVSAGEDESYGVPGIHFLIPEESAP